jgi:hypothetical protein
MVSFSYDPTNHAHRRVAHAGNKHHWVGPDHDRPLSVAGQGEAHGLLTRLASYPIGRILSVPPSAASRPSPHWLPDMACRSS